MNKGIASKFRTLFSDTVVFAIGNLMAKLVVLFLLPLYTSAMSTSQYGTAELVNNSSELLYPVLTLCIYEAVFRFALDTGADHRAVFSNSLTLLLIMIPVASVVTFAVNLWWQYEYAWYLNILVCAMALRILCAQFVKGLGLVRPFAMSGVITSVALFLLNMLLLVAFHLGISGYLMAMIAANLLTTLYLVLRCRLWRYAELGFQKPLMKEMLLYSLPMVPNILAWWLNNMSGRYIVLYYYGAGVAGLFTAASKLPSVINMFSAVFQQAWQMSTAREIQTKSGHAFFSQVFKLYSGFIILGSSALITLLPWFSHVMLKNEFYEARVYVPFLVLSAVFNCYNVFFGTFYTAIKKNRMIMVSTLAGTGANLAIALALTPVIGVWGAIIGNLIGFLLIVGMRVVDTRQYVKVTLDWRIHAPAMLLLGAQALVITLDVPNAMGIAIGMFAALVALESWHYKRQLLQLLKAVNCALHSPKK